MRKLSQQNCNAHTLHAQQNCNEPTLHAQQNCNEPTLHAQQNCNAHHITCPAKLPAPILHTRANCTGWITGKKTKFHVRNSQKKPIIITK